MTIKTPSARDWQGKRILLRLDLNVPLSPGRIADDFKLRAVLPTIRRFRAKAALIIVTHIGEPSGKASDRKVFSVSPVVLWLRRRLGRRIIAGGFNWNKLKRQALGLKVGDILILENMRLFPGESDNSPVLARKLAQLGDAVINDAFAVSHRANASISAIGDFLPMFAGPHLAEEVKNLDYAMHGRQPLLTVVGGGVKLPSKLPFIRQLLRRSNAVLTGGAIANTFLKAAGNEIGHSLFDVSSLSSARKLLSKKIAMPIDVVVVNQRDGSSVKKIEDVTSTDTIIDIGPATRIMYGKKMDKARTIVWNGPMGIFEKKTGMAGTKALAKAIVTASKRGAYTLIGGGETLSAVSVANRRNLNWVSTGGGATLSYLAGLPMPGLKNIIS